MATTESLTSWMDGAAKSAIVDFVARVTKEGSADYLPAAGRIAIFDNDVQGGRAVLMKAAELDSFDDREAKPATMPSAKWRTTGTSG